MVSFIRTGNRHTYPNQSLNHDHFFHQDLQLSQRKEKEDLKKRIQEKNKQLLDKDERDMMHLVKMKNENDLKSAAQKKENRLLQETMVIIL